MLSAFRSRHAEPALVNPSEPEITPPITRVAAALSTVTAAAFVPKLTGRPSDELPEVCEESIVVARSTALPVIV